MNDLAEWVGLGGYTPDQWQAVGTMIGAGAAVVTVIVAMTAAAFAWQQVKHARQLRDEQAQPYVVVDFESSRNILLNLVVRNTGLTVAHDVKLTFDPPLVSTFDDDDNRKPTLAETQFMTKGIPTMPPGRTWTALFERGPDRKDRDDLPRAYDVTVTFRDSQNRKYSLPYRLDLDIFFGIRNLGIYDMHDAAEALREIKKTVGEWTDGHHGLAVFARDGDAKDERSREQMRKHREMFERNRREDGSIISEWVEQQMGSEWNEHQVRVEALPRSESRESIAARFRSRRRARTQVPRRLRAAERDSGHRRGLA